MSYSSSTYDQGLVNDIKKDDGDTDNTTTNNDVYMLLSVSDESKELPVWLREDVNVADLDLSRKRRKSSSGQLYYQF